MDNYDYAEANYYVGHNHEFSEIDHWWTVFHNAANFPLYCIILADTSDSEVALLMENYRQEIAEISGKDCCFIYFRDLDKAKNLFPFEYREHTRYVYFIAYFIGIASNKLPCLLFFEKLVSGKYISISLANHTPEEIVVLIREIFSHIRHHTKPSRFLRTRPSRLSQLTTFKYSQVMNVAKDKLIQNSTVIVKQALVEFLTGFLTFLFKEHL